jgi:hypothetical protein
MRVNELAACPADDEQARVLPIAAGKCRNKRLGEIVGKLLNIHFNGAAKHHLAKAIFIAAESNIAALIWIIKSDWIY